MPTFKLIHSKNYFETKSFRVIGLTVFFATFILTGTRTGETGNGLLKAIGLEELDYFFITIQVLTGIMLLFTYFYSRKNQVKGKVEFTPDQISIDSNKGRNTYNIRELQMFKITHNSYTGDDYEQSPLNNYVGDNWVMVESNGETIKFEFLVDSIFKSNQLKSLIKGYSENLQNFEMEVK